MGRHMHMEAKSQPQVSLLGCAESPSETRSSKILLNWLFRSPGTCISLLPSPLPHRAITGECHCA